METGTGSCVPARKEMFEIPPPLRLSVGPPVVTSKAIVSLISWPVIAR
jgi:hypothetical protein